MVMAREIMSETPVFGGPVSIVADSEGEAFDAAAVSASLAGEIAATFGPPESEPLSVRAYADGRLVGGLNGVSHWRWLYIRHFWVDAGWRGAGLGRRLLTRAEDEARAKHRVGLYLDTFDPGAARFYERCGFLKFGEIPDFPPGHTRTFLRKSL